MARGGHNRKPTALKLIQGTAQPCRMPENEPRPAAAKSLRAPAGMDRESRKAWNRLVPVLESIGLLTDADIETFTALCQAWGRYTRAVARLREVQQLIGEQTHDLEELDRRLSVARRAEVSVEKAEQSFRLFSTEFGLSPASRSRLSVDAPADDSPTILGQMWSRSG